MGQHTWPYVTSLSSHEDSTVFFGRNWSFGSLVENLEVKKKSDLLSSVYADA